MCRVAGKAQLLNYVTLTIGVEPPIRNAACKQASRRKSTCMQSATRNFHSTATTMSSLGGVRAAWKLGITLVCCLLAHKAAAAAPSNPAPPPAATPGQPSSDCAVNTAQDLVSALVNTQCSTFLLEGRGLALTQSDWMAAAARTTNPSVQYGQVTVSRNIVLRGARSGSTVLDCGHLKARVVLAANVTFRIQDLILLNCRQPSAPGVDGLDLWVLNSESTLTVVDSVLELDVCPPLGALSSAATAAPRPVVAVAATSGSAATQSVRLGTQFCLPDALLEPNCWAASLKFVDYASEGTSLALWGVRITSGLALLQNTSLVCAEHDGGPACSAAATAVLLARSLSAVSAAAAEHNLWGCVAGSVVNLGLVSWDKYDMPHMVNASSVVNEEETGHMLAIALPSVVVGMVLLLIFLGLAIWDRQRVKFSPNQEVVKEAYEGVVFVGLSEGSEDGHPDGLDLSGPTGGVGGAGNAVKRKGMTTAMALKAMAIATSSEGAWSDTHSPRSWKPQTDPRNPHGRSASGVSLGHPCKGLPIPMVGISVLPPSPIATSAPAAVPSRLAPPRAGAATTAVITRVNNSSGGGAPINLATIAPHAKSASSMDQHPPPCDLVSLMRRSPHRLAEVRNATVVAKKASDDGGRDRSRDIERSKPASSSGTPHPSAIPSVPPVRTSPGGNTPAPIATLRHPSVHSRIPTSPRSPLPPPSSPSLLPLPPSTFFAGLSPPNTSRHRSPSPSPTNSVQVESEDSLPPPIPLNLIPGLDVCISNQPAPDRAATPHVSVMRGTMGRLPVTVRLFRRGALAGGSSRDGLRGLPKEMAVLAGMQHPNLLMVLGMGEGPGAEEVFLVEEVAVASLARVCHEGGGLPLERALRVARDVVAGLSYLHAAGLEHGNLKPSSVLLDNGGTAKLTDFGFPRLTAAGADSAVAESATVPYLAPECVRGRARRNTTAKVPATTQADIYSFGVMLWEMLSRERPWRGLNAVQVAMAVGLHNRQLEIPTTDRFPPKVRKLLQQCWDEDPKKRPTAADLHKRFSLMV